MDRAVDAHQHFWNPARLPLPWLGPEHGFLNGAFEPVDLEPLLAESGVDQTVLVQSACLDADTESMLEHADAHDWIGAVVGWLPLESPAGTAARLEELADRSKLRGIRHLLHEEDDPHWILRPAVLESLALVERAGLVLEVPAIFPRHLGDVPTIARSFPELTIVVNHLAKPPLDGYGFEEWVRQLRAVATEPNVAAKISGLNTATAKRHWCAADLEPAIEVALEAFGPGRLLCGSDWPVLLLNGDYPQVWRETRHILSACTESERSQVLTGTATRLYSLPPGV